MSGWDIGSLSDILLGLFIASLGVQQILYPAPDADRAIASELRHGDSADLSAARRSRWLPGALYVAGGLMIILTRHPDSSNSRTQIVFLFVMGAVLLFGALAGLFGRPRAHVGQRRRWFNVLWFGFLGAGFLAAGVIGARQ